MTEIKNDFDYVEGTYIGIDFGTTNSVVTFFKKGKFEQVLFRKQKILPSVIFFEENGQVTYGRNASVKGIQNPERVIKEFKRDLGSQTKYRIVFPFDENKEKKAIVVDKGVLLNSNESDFIDNIDQDDKVFLLENTLQDLNHIRHSGTGFESIAEIILEKIEKIKDEIQFISGDLNDLDLAMINDLSEEEQNLIALTNFVSRNNNDYHLVTDNNKLKSRAKKLGLEVISSKEYKAFPKTDNNSSQKVKVKIVTPLEASRYLLTYIKDESKKFLNEEIENAVITVPANYSQDQTGIIQQAATLAGFKNVRLLKEPIAVGYAYAIHESQQENKNVLVYDFGGGTFDVSLLSLENKTITVKSTDGDAKLGGKDITDAVVNLILDKILDEYNVDLFESNNNPINDSSYNHVMSIIKSEAETIKIALSDEQEIKLDIPNLAISEDQQINVNLTISRKEFEKSIVDIRKKITNIIKDVLKPENIDKTNLELVVAGGSSNIPCLREDLEKILNIKPKMTIDSSTVISQGATIEAIREWGNSNTLQEKIISNDTALYDFGIGVKDNRFDLLIPAKEPLPTRREREYTTEKNDQDTINIRAYQRKAHKQDSLKTYDDGIHFIDEIIVQGIPVPNEVGDYTIKVIFELTKDDTLALEVELYDSQGNLQDSNQLKTTRVSSI